MTSRQVQVYYDNVLVPDFVYTITLLGFGSMWVADFSQLARAKEYLEANLPSYKGVSHQQIFEDRICLFSGSTEAS
jgi:hypothetical protein